MGVSRFLYNKALEYLNKNPKTEKTIQVLRNQFINSECNFVKNNSFLSEINYEIKDEALRDLIKNYKSNFAKKKAFKLKFRSKKYSSDSFSVLSKHWNRTKGFYGELFNLKCEKELPKKLEHTCRIIKTKRNEYFICIPRYIEIKESPKDKLVAIDPGIRTFGTCYDPEGLIIKIGKETSYKIGEILLYRKKIRSKRDLSKGKFKKKLTKVLSRINTRLKNLIDNEHKKIANFLCSNYNTIVIPKLNFHSFKNMNKKVKEKFIALSHCKFVDRLIMKSKHFKDCKVEVITEEYTSKTCSCCNFIKNNLGSSSEFNCDNCHKVMCRDSNGAYNIYRKYMRNF